MCDWFQTLQLRLVAWEGFPAMEWEHLSLPSRGRGPTASPFLRALLRMLTVTSESKVGSVFLLLSCQLRNSTCSVVMIQFLVVNIYIKQLNSCDLVSLITNSLTACKICQSVVVSSPHSLHVLQGLVGHVFSLLPSCNKLCRGVLTFILSSSFYRQQNILYLLNNIFLQTHRLRMKARTSAPLRTSMERFTSRLHSPSLDCVGIKFCFPLQRLDIRDCMDRH